jgi:ribonuclease HI
MLEVTIVTDGSCIGNPGPGGWACILRSGEHTRELSGSDQETTSNRMELMAAIEGLRALKVSCRVRLVSDSQYLKKGITELLSRWKSNGWVKSNGEPVLNQDLWDQLDQIAQKHEIQWEWIAGHGDHTDQNRADQLALQSARAQAAREAR